MMQQRWTRLAVVDRIGLILNDMLIDWTPSDGEQVHLFDDLGLDSLDGYDMVARLEEAFDLAADPDAFARTLSIHSVVAAVCEQLAAAGRYDS
jgi:acyl carrier protein